MRSTPTLLAELRQLCANLLGNGIGGFFAPGSPAILVSRFP
jgi:hypothetical protein